MKRRYLKIALCIMLVASAMASLCICANAEGSITLIKAAEKNYSKYTTQIPARAYIEWMPGGNTLGITRTTVLKVYAKRGETILLGSSTIKAKDGKDIVLRTPGGEEKVFDVEGYKKKGNIYSKAAEEKGPYYEIYGKKINEGGFEPFDYEVKEDGIYEVEFHARDDDANSGPDKTNPTSINTDFAKKIYTFNNKGDYTGETKISAVAAWDVTVINKAGEPETGRLFAKYIAFNPGERWDTYKFFADFYIVTQDGYQYLVQPNGIQPWGFIFYSNDKGIVYTNEKGDEVPLYKSWVYGSGQKDPIKMPNGKTLYPRIQKPNNDEALDRETNSKTHSIFFNPPAQVLFDDNIFPSEPEEPARVTGFKFVGDDGDEDSEAQFISDGNNGTFLVGVNKATPITIKIDIDHDGKYTKNSVDVFIDDNADEGINRIIWDGKNGLGQDLGQHFTADKVIQDFDVIVETKAGEYHMPMIDAEHMPNGFSGHLLNTPWKMIEYMQSKDEKFTFDPYMLYYDASLLEPIIKNKGCKPIKPFYDGSNGVSTKNEPILQYGYNGRNDYWGGENTAHDIWALFPADYQETIVMVGEKNEGNVLLNGLVFEDKNENKKQDKDEKPLKNVPVKIKIFNLDGSLLKEVDRKTGAKGKWTYPVPKGCKYEVSVNKEGITSAYLAGYKLTTGNDVQTGTTTAQSKASFALNPVGYYMDSDVGIYTKLDKMYENGDFYNQGDEGEYTVTVRNDTPFDIKGVFVTAPMPAGVDWISDDSNGAYIAGKGGEWNIGDLSGNTTKQIKIKVRFRKTGNHEFKANVTSAKKPDANPDNDTYSVLAKSIPIGTENLIPGNADVPSEKHISHDYAYMFTAYKYVENPDGTGKWVGSSGAQENVRRGDIAEVLYRMLRQNKALEPGFTKPTRSSFPDLNINDDYLTALSYFEHIGAYNSKGSGGSKNAIKPEEYISRAEAAMLIAFAFGYETERTPTFADIGEGDHLYKYIAAVVNKGIMQGKGDNKFCPYDKLTRGEFAVIINKVLGRTVENNYKMLDTSGKQVNVEYSDVDPSYFAYTDMIFATHSFTKSGTATDYRIDWSKPYEEVKLEEEKK